MVSDALKLQTTKTLSLTDIIVAKTQGNAFFSRDLLTFLYHEGLLAFDYDQRIWTWDTAVLRLLDYADNVAESVRSTFSNLPIRVQKILGYAACLGNRFTKSDLGVICDEDIDLVDEATKTGWIIDSKSSYKFLHVSFEAVAIHCLSSQEQCNAHYRIGSLLLKRAKENNNLDEHLLSIVSHWNKCDTITDEKENTIELIRLNVTAAEMCMNNSNGDLAAQCIAVAVSLLGHVEEYSLLFHILHTELKVTIFNRKFEQAIELAKKLQKQTETQLDHIRVSYLLITTLNNLSKYDDAYMAVFEIVNQYKDICYGLSLDSDQNIGLWIKQRLGELMPQVYAKADSILTLPRIQDELIQLFLGTLVRSIPSFFLSLKSSKAVYGAVCVLCGLITFQYGICSWSTGALGAFGVVIASKLTCSVYIHHIIGLIQDYKNGFKLGAAAVQLSETEYTSGYDKCVAGFFMGVLAPAKENISGHASILNKTMLTGMECGEDMFGGYCAGHYIAISLHSGMNNTDWLEISRITGDYIRKTGSPANISIMRNAQQISMALTGESDEFVIDGSYPYPEHVMMSLPLFRQAILLAKAMFKFFTGNNSDALRDVREAEKYQPETSILWFGIYVSMYKGLIVTTELDRDDLDEKERNILIEELQAAYEDVKKRCTWYEKYLAPILPLLEAEVTIRKKGISSVQSAMALYRAAINTAKEVDFPMAACLAMSRQIITAQRAGLSKEIVVAHVNEALAGWSQMGASGVVSNLMDKYRILILTQEETPTPEPNKHLSAFGNTMAFNTTMSMTSMSTYSRKSNGHGMTSLFAESDELDLSTLFLNMVRCFLTSN
jgi:tetratricopeptide (TPR) repeat protein